MSRYVTGVRARSRIMTRSSKRLLRSPRELASSATFGALGLSFVLSATTGFAARAVLGAAFPFVDFAVRIRRVISQSHGSELAGDFAVQLRQLRSGEQLKVIGIEVVAVLASDDAK